MKRNTYFVDEPVEEKKKIDIDKLKRLAVYAIPYKKSFILVLLLVITCSVLSLIPNLILRYIINTVIPDKDMNQLMLTMCGYALLVILQIVLPWIYSRILADKSNRIIATIREEFFNKLQKLAFDYYDSRPSGKISICVTNYIADISEFFASYLVSFVVNILQIVIVTVCMLVISPILTAVIYSAIIPLLICFHILRKVLRKMFTSQRAKDSNRAAFTMESIQGERVVKSFNRSAQNEDIYENLIQKQCVENWYRILVRLELYGPTFELFWNYGSLMIYFVAIVCMSRGIVGMDAGTVVLFINYLGFCSGPFLSISNILQSLASVSSYLDRIFGTLDIPNTIEDKPDAVNLEHIKGQVDFENVRFGYEEGIDVIKDFNLSVRPGEMIALVGPTGAGKTTIINLITRFYDVKDGSVKIDGVDVRDISLHSLRTEIGVIMQEPYIFKGSLMDNIRYGRLSATDEECIAAAQAIHADMVVNRFPEKYDHQVGENGEGLSAGEKQLISIARIILKNPSVVILDEATSSVDSETEQLIQSALNEALVGKTSFIVAHRLSTIRRADRILYIANHGIAEQGNHQELMEKKGLYYRLNMRK